MIYLAIYLIGILVVSPFLKVLFEVMRDTQFELAKEKMKENLANNEEFMAKYEGIVIDSIPDEIFQELYYKELKKSFYLYVILWPISLIMLAVGYLIQKKKGRI